MHYISLYSFLGLFSFFILGLLGIFKYNNKFFRMFMMVIMFIGYLFYRNPEFGAYIAPQHFMHIFSMAMRIVFVDFQNEFWILYTLFFIASVSLVFFFGNIFCGWMCFVGAFQEILYLPFKWLTKGRFVISKKVDDKLSYFRYFILFCTIFVLIFYQDSFVAMIYRLGNGKGALFMFCLVTLPAFFLYRPYCKWFCPFGGFLGIISKYGKASLSFDKNCVGCKLVEKKCLMNAIVCEKDKEIQKSLHSRCISCGECLRLCPKGSLKFKFSSKIKN